MSSPRLAGKTVIVTGATMGIGESMARRFADEGAELVLVARGREGLEGLAGELGGAQFVAGSVADPGVAEAAVELAERRGGSDVLVNNAGLDLSGDLLEATEEDVREVFEVNFFGAFWMLQHAARAMRPRGSGSIVNITSRLASIGVPKMALYGASKCALLSLTRGAAVELAPSGIRVNAVAPGMVDTPLMRAWLDGDPGPNALRRSVEAAIP